ncbi:hypothetical protein ACB098_06G008800 [Castanea mollissima]
MTPRKEPISSPLILYHFTNTIVSGDSDKFFSQICSPKVGCACVDDQGQAGCWRQLFLLLFSGFCEFGLVNSGGGDWILARSASSFKHGPVCCDSTIGKTTILWTKAKALVAQKLSLFKVYLFNIG